MTPASDVEGFRSSARPLPPGTVELEQVNSRQGERIILHPVPTDDPNDPLNWSPRRKAINFGLVCFYALVVYSIIDIATVVYGQVHDELGFSYEELNRSFAVSDAGIAIGGVLFLPLAFKYGRRPVYLFSIVVQLGTAVWQAKMQNLADLYGFNMINGLASSISESICAITLADMFFVHQRGSLTNMLTISVNIGTFLAPVAAGYSAASQGWRWIWWWSVILSGFTLLLFVFFYEETLYTPAMRHAPPMDAEEKQDIQAMHDEAPVADHSPKRQSYWRRMFCFQSTGDSLGAVFRHTYQPFIVTFTFPGVAFVALVYGSALTWLAVVLNVQAIYFIQPPYNFSSAGVGLMNIPTLIGCILGSIFGGPFSDFEIRRLAKRNGGIYEPEMRLYLAIPALLIMPAGYFMFGLTLAKGMHWIIPAVGLGIYGFGNAAFSNILLVYLVDSYRDVIGDAYIGITFVRNCFGVLGAMCLTPWIDRVGVYNMIVSSGCIAIAVSLLTVLIIVWGRRCREWTAARYMVMASKQFDSRVASSMP